MDENLDKPGREQLNAWTKKQLDAAVRKLMNLGVIDSMIVEAKPAWVLPFQILIGKIRAHGQAKDFDWFICGELPTDFVGYEVASTPREAARHFAMKWQLEVARHKDLSGQESPGPVRQLGETGSQLAETAEALYELADDESLWLQQDGF
jgi:hypothetical protein